MHQQQITKDWPSGQSFVICCWCTAIVTFSVTFLGQFDFSGDLDVVQWIKTAQEVGLLVICRVGPYITSEVDFGGFPYWLINVPNVSQYIT